MRTRGLLAAVLAATFLSFWAAPLYMGRLRERHAAALPEAWERVGNNGRFAYVSTLLITTRNYEESRYAMKVRSALVDGLPYDPYTRERGLRSWVFDSLMFLPLVPFAALAGGDVQRGWVLAHASLATLWVWLLYAVLARHPGGRRDPETALVLAAGLFFFGDSIRHLLGVWHIPPGGLTTWLFLLTAYACGQVQWMRLPSPGMTALILFGLLYSVYRLACAERPKPAVAALAGIGIGLLCLAHAFEWLLGCFTLGIYMLLSWRMGLPRPGRMNLVVATGTALAASIGYYVFARGLTAAVMPDLISRVGLWGRHFQWRCIVPLGFGLLFLAKAARSEGPGRWAWLLWASLPLAVIPAGNFSLLTGYDLQFYGHVLRLCDFAVPVALAVWLAEKPERVAWLKTHARPLLLLIFCWVFLREKNWSDTHYKIFGTPRHLEAALDWADKSLPERSLVLTVSGVTSQQLALRTRARQPVTPGNPNYGSPRATAEILAGLASSLRAARADLDRFIPERWEKPTAKDGRMQDWAYHMRDVDLELVEQAAWAPLLLDVQGWDEAAVARLSPELRRLAAAAPDPERPYYLWLNRLDERYLTEPPERRGGLLAYQNPDVRVYEFR